MVALTIGECGRVVKALCLGPANSGSSTFKERILHTAVRKSVGSNPTVLTIVFLLVNSVLQVAIKLTL